LECVLQLLGRAVRADGRSRPAEVGRALLDDVALDLAGLDAAADERDLLARGHGLADRGAEADGGRPRRRLAGQGLRAGDARAAGLGRRPAGGAAVAAAAAAGGQRGADHEQRGALVDEHALLLLCAGLTVRWSGA